MRSSNRGWGIEKGIDRAVRDSLSLSHSLGPLEEGWN